MGGCVGGLFRVVVVQRIGPKYSISSPASIASATAFLFVVVGFGVGVVDPGLGVVDRGGLSLTQIRVAVPSRQVV